MTKMSPALVSVLFLFPPALLCSANLLHSPIRITPRPPQTEAHHGPMAAPEPADGYPFVGIGERQTMEGEWTPGQGQQQQQDGQNGGQRTADSSRRKNVYKNCFFKYIPSTCNHTEHCETHRLCVQITGDPCCAPGEGECPSPVQLGVRCLKVRPINWCHHNSDCARDALCCDTGCGYNMCVERQQI